jgi:hypothetical protein
MIGMIRIISRFVASQAGRASCRGGYQPEGSEGERIRLASVGQWLKYHQAQEIRLEIEPTPDHHGNLASVYFWVTGCR